MIPSLDLRPPKTRGAQRLSLLRLSISTLAVALPANLCGELSLAALSTLQFLKIHLARPESGLENFRLELLMPCQERDAMVQDRTCQTQEVGR